jgi:two-component system OmpR family response regulator
MGSETRGSSYVMRDDGGSDAAPVAGRQRILVVDDDPDIVRLLTVYLNGQGFDVASASSAVQLRERLHEASHDLVLLDLGLPDEDGLVLLRLLRERAIPVIVVSGRGEAVERIVGLELGADDYVTKPFDFRELVARVRTVLRRGSARNAAEPAKTQCLVFDGLSLDVGSRRLTGRDGAEIPLTTGEFNLLHALVERPRQVQTRDQLMNSLQGRDAGPYDRAIDVQVGRLRRKIEIDPESPRLLKSVRGVGYLLASDVRKS